MAQELQMRRRSGYAALPGNEGQPTTDSLSAVLLPTDLPHAAWPLRY
jgi:hypothetical protein